MEELIQQHLKYLSENRYSHATITARGKVLSRLPAHLDLDRQATQAWWATRQTKEDGVPRAASSLSSEASHAREFWRWAMMNGLLTYNPGDWLPKVRQTSTMAVSVSEAQLSRALHNAEPPMRRMVALAAMAGLRSSEIAAIKWSDIDRDNGVLWVRLGKGGKDRSVSLSGGLLAELGEPEEGCMTGNQMNGKAVSMAIGRYLRSQDIDFSAHKLRARCATRFLAATGDAVAAAEMLGHSDLNSILRYAVASGDTMRRGAEAAGRIG